MAGGPPSYRTAAAPAPSPAPLAAAPVSSKSFGPPAGGPAYQSALAGGPGPEPSPSFEPAPSFGPPAAFVPVPAGTAGEVVPRSENPYQAPRARVDRPLVASDDPLAAMVMARRLTRLAAAILDTIILLIPIFLGLAVSGDFTRLGTLEPDEAELTMLMLRRMFTFGLPIFAINIYLLAKSGQSLGKKALGIKIVRTDGTRASLGRLLMLRIALPNVLGAVPTLGQLFGLLDALFIFGEERRCIHDHFADTMVVVA